MRAIHPPTASVGNDTSILNTLKIVPCCLYSTQQHYYFGQLNNVFELTSQLRNVSELTKFSFYLTDVIKTKKATL